MGIARRTEPTETRRTGRSSPAAHPLRVDARRLSALLPAPGAWTAEDYLWLTRATGRLVELADGWIEALPMPTDTHQRILGRLHLLLTAQLAPRRSLVRFAPLRLRLAERRFREPDLLVLLDPHDARRGDDYWRGADLVVEILSATSADHDLVTKRAEYAAAGIPAYWIVDPTDETVTVLTLAGARYAQHGRFGPSAVLTSPRLDGLALPVAEVFADD